MTSPEEERQVSMLTITPPAQETLYQMMRSAGLGEGYAARLKIVGRTLEGFKYDFRTVPLKERTEEDRVLDVEKFTVYIDERTARNIAGTIIDVKPEGGLKIDNPNIVIPNTLAREVVEALDTKINPGVGTHGGQVLLIDADEATNIVYLNMEGGCKGCGMARTTFKLGIERMLKDAIPAVAEVVDVTEHTKGLNPYYQSDTQGESPLDEGK
jgi:Fe/S biogenesis protein NfuA